MEKFLEFLSGWWKEDAYGKTPEVIDSHLQTGDVGRGLKWRITWRAGRIISKHSSNNHKFGKSGQPPERVKFDDYTNDNPYTKMFLLYESKSKAKVSEMELYYIKKYKQHPKNDNVSETDKHDMKSYNEKYYLYLVI